MTENTKNKGEREFINVKMLLFTRLKAVKNENKEEVMKKIVFSLCSMLCLILLGCGDDTTISSGTTNPKGTVQGFVRDYKTNAPIENVTVKLFSVGPKTTTTDEDGYWYITGVPAQSTDGVGNENLVYTLTGPDVDEDGSADYLGMRGYTLLFTLDDGQSNALTSVDDWMVQTATVSGFVTDSATGKGVNDATVVILDFVAAGNWQPGQSNALVDSLSLEATTAARAEGGDGYYSITSVPAMAIAANNFGAYATGYEYGRANLDDGGINLQFGSSAIVDFQINPLDNALGLVVASVTTATDTTTDMMIMIDATGNVPAGTIAKVDMNGATQLVFNLIFDQPIDTTRFFGDTIQLHDLNGVVLPNMTPVWSTGNYAVTLTGDIDVFDDLLTNPYELRTGGVRMILAATGGQDIGVGSLLAQFQAYNSTFVAANPTPALFLDLVADTSIVGNINVNSYDASSQVNPTTAQFYTGIYEENVLNLYALTQNPLADGVDIYWTDAEPVYDISDINVYVRERDPASGEVLNNWAEIINPLTFQADDRIIVRNLDIITAQFEFYGGVADTLRFGNALDIAVTVNDTLGVENAIDTTKILTLTDAQAPEIDGFVGAVYHNRLITFSELMSATGMSISASNSALFTVSPEWDQNDMTQLRINAVGTASATVSTTAADSIVAATGVITFDTAGDADLFYVGQLLTVTYANGDTENAIVGAIDTAPAAPTITIAGYTDDMTQAATISVRTTNTFRSGNGPVVFAGGGVGDTDLTFAGITNVAVGDTLILRNSTQLGTDLAVTVVDFNSATGTATIAATDTTGYDRVLFPGDILTVTATDEAGNAMHSHANEITDDNFGAWPANPAIK